MQIQFRIRINPSGKDEQIVSDMFECTEEEFEKLDTQLLRVVSGEIQSFAFKMNNRKIFFPRKILDDSIIEVISAL